jgi:hypothetical protein
MKVLGTLTQGHIVHGKRENCESCPFSLALCSQGFGDVYVDNDTAEFTVGGKRYRGLLPKHVQDAITMFDLGGAIDPFTFEFEAQEVIPGLVPDPWEDAVNKLLEFLRNVDESTARQLWLWLDADPNALDRMISTVVDSHSFEHPGKKGEAA